MERVFPRGDLGGCPGCSSQYWVADRDPQAVSLRPLGLREEADSRGGHRTSLPEFQPSTCFLAWPLNHPLLVRKTSDTFLFNIMSYIRKCLGENNDTFWSERKLLLLITSIRVVCNEGWFDGILFYSLSIYTLWAPQTPGVRSIAFMLLETYCSLVIVECKWQPERLDVANIDLVLAKWMHACPRYLHCAIEN